MEKMISDAVSIVEGKLFKISNYLQDNEIEQDQNIAIGCNDNFQGRSLKDLDYRYNVRSMPLDLFLHYLNAEEALIGNVWISL